MRHLLGKTVAADQNKGGSGKTTLILGLALTVQRHHPDLDLVVVDLEGQAAAWIKRFELPLRYTRAFPREGNHFTLVDTPGGNPLIASEGIRRSDLVLVPLRASQLDFGKSAEVIQAVQGAERTIGWVPSQVHTGVESEDGLGATLRQMMHAGAESMPPGLVLPPIRYLPSMPAFLQGRTAVHPARDFDAVWRKLDAYLKRTKT